MRNPELKKAVLNRLKSIEGHVRGIERMVDEDQYCVDILTQTAAIHKALERVDALILENHLETCVTTAIRGDDPAERERVIRELMGLFQGGPAAGVSRQIGVPDVEAILAGSKGGNGDTCC